MNDRFDIVFEKYFGWFLVDDMEPIMETNIETEQDALLARAILSSHCPLDSQQPDTEAS